MSALRGNPSIQPPQRVRQAAYNAFISSKFGKKKQNKTKRETQASVFKGQIQCGRFWRAGMNLTSGDLIDLKVLLKIYGGMFGPRPC